MNIKPLDSKNDLPHSIQANHLVDVPSFSVCILQKKFGHSAQ